VFGVQAGILVVLLPFLQVVLGWSALHATVGLLPMAVLMMASSVLAPKVAQRAGSRPTMALGVGLVTAGLVLMATLISVDGGYLTVLPGVLTLGFGMGLAMTPSTEAITSSLPRDKQGLASALNDVTREFGTAIGVALLGAILTAGYRNAIEPQLDGVPNDVAQPAREGLANAVAAADDLSDRSRAIVDAAQHSFVDGWQHAMWAGAAAMAALFLFTIVRPKNPDRTDLDTVGTE
jgi:Na+/melibiose symporter-like transporter